jgi:hypothetical protein
MDMNELRPHPSLSCRRTGFPALPLILVLIGTLTATHAMNFVMDTFDHDIAKWFGLTSTLTFDPTQDNTGNGGGSCHAGTDFSTGQSLMFVGAYGPLTGGWESNMTLNLSAYKSVEFNVKWDNTSTMSLADFNQPPSGGNSTIDITSVKPDFSRSGSIGSFSIPAAATNGWAHVSVPINQAIYDMDPSTGLWFQKWISAGGGTANFWLDNVRLAAWPCSTPPPRLWLYKADAGLNLFAGSGNPYDRENIRTTAGFCGQSWVGLGNVGYSFSVSRYCASTGTGFPFQIHMFLVPNAGNTSAPDLNDPDVLAALLLPQPDGSAVWSVQVKTNCTGSCAWQVYGQITNASPLGTWSLIFDDDTNLTLVTPAGSLLQSTLPVEVVNRFAGAPLTVYFGYMASFGPAVLSQVRFSRNGSTTFQDDFSTGLDTNVWEVKAAYPPSVQPVSANAYWLNWGAPLECDTAQLFVLATNANLANPNGWGTNQLPAAVQLGSMKYVCRGASKTGIFCS